MPDSRPLKGIKIVEFAGLGPAPYAGQLLADLGAEVVVVDRPTRGEIALQKTVNRRGKRSIVIDLKAERGLALAAQLAEKSDILIEGNRPGVMERLGLGPEVLLQKNPKLIYARMTGWGQTGPMALQAGHDINYLSLTGALQAMGDSDRPPPPPLNLVGDFGGGSMFLIMGILAALHSAKSTGKGQVVDAAIVDGVNSMMGMFFGLHAAGRWGPERQSNWLDGGAPYYRCYRCSDGRFVAVGCIEAKFFAEMLEILSIDPEEFGPQNDPSFHKAQMTRLETVFAQHPMAHWQQVFAGSDACVTPVLRYDEVENDPHMAARHALEPADGISQPAVAPRFESPIQVPHEMPQDGEDTLKILEELGVEDIDALLELNIVRRA